MYAASIVSCLPKFTRNSTVALIISYNVFTLPLAIMTGLALSPAMAAAWPWLLDLFGGRQSARSLHFLAMIGIAAFTIVHLALVILAGPVNEVRSMLTGKWRVPE